MKTFKLIILLGALLLSTAIIAQDTYLGTSAPEGYQYHQTAQSGAREFTGCLPCAIPEGEADIPDDGLDITNGGCNNDPPIYTDIQIGDVYCGRGNGYIFGGQDYRDTDWYRIVLTESKTLYWSGVANFDAVFFIVEGLCDNLNVVAQTVPGPGNVGTCSATIGPGTYAFFVAPNGFGPGAGLTGDYMAYLSDAPPQDPWCALVPVSDWAIFLGIFLIMAFAVVRLRRL